MKAAMDGEMKHFYEFGPFRVDPTKRLLMRDKEPQPTNHPYFNRRTTSEQITKEPWA